MYPTSECSTSMFFFFSSRRRHTRFDCDWSSDVCSSDLLRCCESCRNVKSNASAATSRFPSTLERWQPPIDRKSTRLNSSHSQISYAVFCLKKKKQHSSTSCLLWLRRHCNCCRAAHMLHV